MNPYEQLEAAKTAVDVLAALAAGIDPKANAPSPEDLATWFPTATGETRKEANTGSSAILTHVGQHNDGAEWIAHEGTLHLEKTWRLRHRGRETTGYTAFSIEDVHELWLWAAEDAELDRTELPPHPLAPIVRAWIKRPRPLRDRHLIGTREKRPPKRKPPLVLARTPGVLHLSTLATVEVDGEPFATAQPGTPMLRRYRIARPRQGELFPGPRTIDGHATGGLLVQTVAALPLDRNERSPLRADVLRLGDLSFALTGSAILSDWEGATLTGGRDTAANRARFNRALGVLRYLAIELYPGKMIDIVDAERGPDRNRLGPPRWWLDKTRVYRLTGGLFRPVLLAGGRGRRGTDPGYWGGLQTTIGGIEGALCYGSSAGKGVAGRISDNLRAVRPGGPGPAVFFEWWRVLRVAGENVGANIFGAARKAASQRFRERCAALQAAGYFTARTATAEAGDTVEIVERVRGSRARTAGLWVRASARYCAAYASGDRIRIPADRLLSPDRLA